MKSFFTDVWAKVWATAKEDLKIYWWVWWRVVLVAIIATIALLALGINPDEGYWMNGFIFALTIALFIYKVKRNGKS